MEKKALYIYIISDSAGDTAFRLTQAALAQYPESEIEVVVKRRPFINTIEKLKPILPKILEHNAIVVHTMIIEEILSYLNQFCEQNNIYYKDMLNPLVSEVGNRLGIEPLRKSGALHNLDDNYFSRIKAMEFAVKYDDGRDPRGFAKADVVLLGISRTSKTPTSLFLAGKNLRVANLPLIPEAAIPEELWRVPKEKIVGLTNDPSVLNNIRKERMRAYGLDPDTTYSDNSRILEELDYSSKIYEKLGCVVINVASLSIEETASIIMDKLHLEDHSYQ